eukprot:57389-Amorphochlora_amoeboformis.AAC.1
MTVNGLAFAFVSTAELYGTTRQMKSQEELDYVAHDFVVRPRGWIRSSVTYLEGKSGLLVGC